MATIPTEYLRDFSYLKEKSDKGQLDRNNAILAKLQAKAHNLPGLKQALNSLKINY